jgi:fluoride exporter
MLKWLFIAVGGAFGSVLRYAVQGWVGQQIAGRSFPIGTIVVNISGCLIIGLLAGFFDGPQLVREEYRVGLLVGILGGYTTFSSFGLETFRLANDGELFLALTNVVVSCVVGLAAVWVGYRLAERWFGM